MPSARATSSPPLFKDITFDNVLQNFYKGMDTQASHRIVKKKLSNSYSNCPLLQRISQRRLLLFSIPYIYIAKGKKYCSNGKIIIEITVEIYLFRLRSPLSPILPYTYIFLLLLEGKGLLTDTVFAACPLLSSWKRGRRCEHDVWSNTTWQPRRTTASVCVCVVPSGWHSAYPEIRYRR